MITQAAQEDALELVEEYKVLHAAYKEAEERMKEIKYTLEHELKVITDENPKETYELSDGKKAKVSFRSRSTKEYDIKVLRDELGDKADTYLKVDGAKLKEFHGLVEAKAISKVHTTKYLDIR